MATGCGSSPASQVAQLGSTPTPSGSSANTSAASAQRTGVLAFAHCMRSNGVPRWPDPDSSGVFDKAKLVPQQLGASSSQVETTQRTCQHLLPNDGQPPNKTGLRSMERDALRFARCMRSHGVPNWPDCTLRGGIPIFDLHGTSVAPNSAQIAARQQRCKSLLHLSLSPPTSGGAR